MGVPGRAFLKKIEVIVVKSLDDSWTQSSLVENQTIVFPPWGPASTSGEKQLCATRLTEIKSAKSDRYGQRSDLWPVPFMFTPEESLGVTAGQSEHD